MNGEQVATAQAARGCGGTHRLPSHSFSPSPLFTCIVISHNKPAHMIEALESLACQTFADWEAIVFDSGLLYDQGFFESLPLMSRRAIPAGPIVGDGGAPPDEDDRVVVLERMFSPRARPRKIRDLPLRR